MVFFDMLSLAGLALRHQRQRSAIIIIIIIIIITIEASNTAKKWKP
jgi:hypothetical protein